MFKFLVLFFVISLTSQVYAQRHKKLELVNFVKDAVKFAKENGFDMSCKEFNDGSKFKKGEFYIFAYDYNGKVLCHGAKKKLIGENLIDFKDREGTFLIKDLIKAANSGGGFVNYVWPLPDSEDTAKKLGYALPVDKKYWVGSGIYFKSDD